MRWIILGLLFAGCHGGDPVDTPDATSEDSSIAIVWAPDPALPGPVDDDTLTVTSARFQLHRIQVIGDAGPGDPRTTRSDVVLLWDATHDKTPATSFDAVPPGLYSLINLDLEGGDREGNGAESYDISGLVEVDGVMKRYHVSDKSDLRFSFSAITTVKEAAETTIMIRLSLDEPLKQVDFRAVPTVNGVLELDGEDPQIVRFRSDLIESFELGPDG